MKVRRLAAATCSAAATFGLYNTYIRPNSNCDVKRQGSGASTRVALADGNRPKEKEWPKITRSELKQHSKFGNAWVVFRNSVYDVSEFVDRHPGGDLIHMAFGKSVEPYWNIFSKAHLKDETIDQLDKYKIGEILSENEDPDTGSIPLDFSGTEFMLNPETYVLNCEVEGKPPVKLTLTDIQTRFPSEDITTIIDCGHGVKRLPYLDKYAGPYEWTEKHESPTFTGVRVFDVLKEAGLDMEDIDSKFIHFQCYDDYTDSIPVRDLAEDGRALLIWKKDGEQLIKENGGPLMALTPGEERLPCDIKWLTKIIVNDIPTRRHGGKYEYLTERKKMLEDCIVNNRHI